MAPDFNSLGAGVLAAINNSVVPGAVIAVGHEGRVGFTQAFGNRQIEPEQEPATVDTVYDLASLTKALVTSLLVMKANSITLIVLAALGIAGITGGTPNLHPSITTYVWGRDKYQAANRWIMAIQAVMMALALYYMSFILDATGSLDLAYKIMLALVGIAIICLVIIGRKPDYDRGQICELS